MENRKRNKHPGTFVAARKMENEGEISSKGPEARVELITEDYKGSGKIKSIITNTKLKRSWVIEHIKEIIIGVIIVIAGGLILNWIL